MLIKSTKLYDVLKYIGRYILPALAAFYVAIAKTWGLPFQTEVAATIMAVDTFLNVILGISNENYNKDGGAN